MKKTAFQRDRAQALLQIFLLTFLCFGLILPIFALFRRMTPSTLTAVLGSESFLLALRQSLISASVATVISMGISSVLAWSVARTELKGKAVFRFLFTLPMLVPSVSHGMGFIILLGSNGILTRLFSLNIQIYGFWGIVLGGVMYSFPLGFLMLLDVLTYEDGAPYRAAQVLGIPKWRQFTAITLPYLKKPLISVAFATFTLVVTDYGVPIMIGGTYTTLPLLMYQEVIGLLDFGKGSVIGFCLLLPAFLTFCVDGLTREKGTLGFSPQPILRKKNPKREGLALIFSLCGSIFVLLPLIAFLLISVMTKYPIDPTFTLANLEKAVDMKAFTYLMHSIFIAVVVSLVGTVITYVTAYLTARVGGKVAGLLHLGMLVSLAVPGLVLGLSYVLFYKETWLYGTFLILIFVNIIHFFASPYLMAYQSFRKINQHLEGVGMTLGISRFYLLKDVFIPQMKSTLFRMMSYLFVNSMITISAIAFLTTSKTMLVSLLITQFEGSLLLECASFVSLLLLSVNVSASLLLGWLGRGQCAPTPP